MTSPEGQVQMSSSETLSLSLLAERIANEHTARLTAERTAMKALELQAQEYERRLQALNHAHEQAVEAQRMTVPRETYDAYLKEARTALDVALANLNQRIEQRAIEVDRRLTTLENAVTATAGQREGSASTVRLAFAGVAALVGLVALYLFLTGK